ncbi:MAG: glycosyltransferase family 1 protein, partial [Planctomycetota bacterium]
FFVQDVDALGGSERQALRLARALAARGARPTIFSCVDDLAPRRWLGAAWPEDAAGVRVHRLPRPAFEPLATAALRRRPERADAIYGVGLMMGAIAARVGRLSGVPVAVKLAGAGATGDVAALEALPPRLRREVLADLSQTTLVCPTAAIEAEARAAGFPPQILVRVPNGVDAAALRGEAPVRPPEAGDDPFVLFAGRLQRVKGLDVLLDAFARLSPPVRLLVAGEGPEETALRTAVLTRHLEERVHFLGRRDDVAGLMREAAALCLPSRCEGLSNTLLEALAVGVPVVASDLPGTREVTGDEAALLVPPEDPAALAAALERVLGDAPLAARLTTAARQRVRGYSLAEVAERTRDLLSARNALGPRPGPLRWAGRFAAARGRELLRRLEGRRARGARAPRVQPA